MLIHTAPTLLSRTASLLHYRIDESNKGPPQLITKIE